MFRQVARPGHPAIPFQSMVQVAEFASGLLAQPNLVVGFKPTPGAVLHRVEESIEGTAGKLVRLPNALGMVPGFH